VILLDTHVLVWLDEANPQLGAGAIERIDTAFKAGEVTVSAISFWEVGMLISKGRIRLDMDLLVWRQDFMEQGLIELPVTGAIGIRATDCGDRTSKLADAGDGRSETSDL
jgi:PIN domain nuclease of toxin-antitoxin system